MVARDSGGLSYRIKPEAPEIGNMRNLAHANCSVCGAEGKVPIGGIRNNPEKIEKLFVRKGWDFDRFNEKRCICDRCVRNREIRLEGERDAARVAASKAARVLPTLEIVRPTAAPMSAPGLMTAVKAGPQPKAPPPPEPMAMSIKDLKPADKASLRTAIEAYFNPDTGQWAAEWSDHRVSEETNIARVVVAEFRDSFYGPIKDDPILRALTDELGQVKAILRNMEETTVPRLERKLDEYRKKVGL